MHMDQAGIDCVVIRALDPHRCTPRDVRGGSCSWPPVIDLNRLLAQVCMERHCFPATGDGSLHGHMDRCESHANKKNDV